MLSLNIFTLSLVYYKQLFGITETTGQQGNLRTQPPNSYFTRPSSQTMERKKRLWWSEYRQKMAPRPRMSWEMVVRSSVRAVAREYMENSSLSGVSYLVDQNKSKKERLFWLIVILTAGVVVLNIVWMSWNDFLGKPIIVSLESYNHPIHSIPFPGVAICNINRISKMAADEYAHKLHPIPNHTLEEVKQQVYRMGRLLDYEVDEYSKMLPFLDHVLSKPGLNEHNLVRRMKQLSPKCEEMLVRCFWAGKIRNCSDIFMVRRTTNGFCCSFNYVRGYNTQGHAFLIDEVKRQRMAGIGNGLLMVIDPLLHDYAYPLHNAEGFDVILFDGNNYPDRGSGRMVNRLMQPNHVACLVLESITVESSAEVRKYSAETRGCRFRDELPEDYFGLYSYTSCIVACRMRTVHSLCKCVPFYLPYFKGNTTTCTLSDIPCLDKYREKLLYMYPARRSGDDGLELELEDSLDCSECLPDCDYTHHSVSAFEYPMQKPIGFNLQYNFLEGINLTNKSVLSVFHETSETTLYRMDIVFYWFELVSNLGGIAGVFVGYSIISIIEMIYFFVFRFCFIIRATADKYYY